MWTYLIVPSYPLQVMCVWRWTSKISRMVWLKLALISACSIDVAWSMAGLEYANRQFPLIHALSLSVEWNGFFRMWGIWATGRERIFQGAELSSYYSDVTPSIHYPWSRLCQKLNESHLFACCGVGKILLVENVVLMLSFYLQFRMIFFGSSQLLANSSCIAERDSHGL